MTPGVRTIPAAIVLPTAAAIPNHTPRTCKSFPGEILARGGTGVVTRAMALGGVLGILGNRISPVFRDRGNDNGAEGKYKAEVVGGSCEERWSAATVLRLSFGLRIDSAG